MSMTLHFEINRLKKLKAKQALPELKKLAGKYGEKAVVQAVIQAQEGK